jgi:hypothetical protein
MVPDSEEEHAEASRDCEPKYVLMTPELMNELMTRNLAGYRVSWDWQEEDSLTHVWSPIGTVDYNDRLYTLAEAKIILDKRS